MEYAAVVCNHADKCPSDNEDCSHGKPHVVNVEWCINDAGCCGVHGIRCEFITPEFEAYAKLRGLI
jgi:hypothetical protein